MNLLTIELVKVAFGNARSVLPYNGRLGWNGEALHMMKKLGIVTLYFSAIDRLINRQVDKRYRRREVQARVGAEKD